MQLYERLHHRRVYYERSVLANFRGILGPHDAEDVVSAAMQHAMTTAAPPLDPGAVDYWFKRLVRRAALDELRRRHGRRRSTQEGYRRDILVSDLEQRGVELVDDEPSGDPESIVDRIGEADDRERLIAVAREALARMEPEDLQLLHVRHIQMPKANRESCAEAAGLTVDAWRHRYKRAWARFIAFTEAAEPSPRCRSIRDLIGVLDGGDLRGSARRTARAEVDVHIDECTACHVLARDSYQILVLIPVGPAAPIALHEWTQRAAAVLDRNAPEAAAGAGAAAGGAGLLAGLSAGGKALIAVCGVSATAAGVCGAIVATLDAARDPAPSRAATVAHRPASTPTAQATATATAAPTTSRRAKASKSNARSSASPESNPPAAAPTGGTGNEFDPVSENAQTPPAPVPAGVSGEFSP